jgi:hypothetical protein
MQPNPTGQKVEIIRTHFPTKEYTITDDAATTPIIERAGLGRMWIQCPAETLGSLEVLGALKATGPFVAPTVDNDLTTLDDSDAPVALPDDYYGLPYLKIVADSGSHTILVGGSG